MIIIRIFKFLVRAFMSGGFTTAPVEGDPVGNDEYLADVCDRCSQPPAVVEPVLRAALEAWIDAAKGTRRVLPFRDLLGSRPTCGGHQDSNVFPGTLANLNAGLALVVGKAGYARFADGFTAERQGEVGLLTPYVDTVTDLATGHLDTYTPTKPLDVHGSELDVDPTDPDQGGFLRSVTTGIVVRIPATDYALIQPSHLIMLPPEGLTGNQILIIKTKIKGSLRSFVYTVELQHS